MRGIYLLTANTWDGVTTLSAKPSREIASQSVIYTNSRNCQNTATDGNKSHRTHNAIFTYRIVDIDQNAVIDYSDIDMEERCKLRISAQPE